MFCDHCGMNIPDDAVLCPYCGMNTGDNTPATSYFDAMNEQQELLDGSAAQELKDAQDAASRGDFSHFGGPRQHPSASHSHRSSRQVYPPVQPHSPQSSHSPRSSYPPYKHGYRPVPSASPQPPQAPYLPVPPSPHQLGYGPQAMPYQQIYTPYAPYASYVPQQVVLPSMHMKSDNATIVELILSLFGIFGVGWLLGGETTTGLILLICSFVIYLPLLFVGIIFTFGLGIFCLGPLAIVAIIINAVLCNRTLKRREAQLLFMQQAVPMSPPVQRQV